MTLKTSSKIARTRSGQLPRNYIAGARSMLKHPMSVGRVGNSSDAGKRHKAKKK